MDLVPVRIPYLEPATTRTTSTRRSKPWSSHRRFESFRGHARHPHEERLVPDQEFLAR